MAVRAVETSASPPLRADRVYRFYRAGDDETLALRGVSVVVNAGEMVAVVGPSGSGKSTLLSCLTGMDEPSGGTVWVAGERLTHRPEPIRARLRADHIGIMGADHNLFDHLSVLGNIRLAQRLSSRRGTSPELLLESVGVNRRRHAVASELSGGEAARAGLAVALANDPAVLVADEPTGELDEGTERRILELLGDRAHGGMAVLVASHSAAVRQRADRVLTLHDGSLVP
jgi:putative ABC transport system ATP-binding protein